MATFTFAPSYSASVEITPRVLRAQLGDGYEQRLADGINTQPRIWTLRFTRTDTDLDAVLAFLQARGATESFQWTPPSGAPGTWVCRSFSRSHNMPGYGEISARFEEVFGV